MRNRLLIVLAGLLFGAGLAVSGMTDPTRVIEFLDVAGAWDATLAFVMAGALLVFGLGYALLQQKCRLPASSGDPISKPLVVGAVLFGVGWGLGGFCPGPALANLGRLNPEAVVFVVTMAAGMVVAQRIFGLDR